MNKFDLKTVKFIVIMTSICIAFAVVVMQAYQYLPEKTNDQDIYEEIEENFSQKEISNNEQSKEHLEAVKQEPNNEEQELEDEQEKSLELKKNRIEFENRLKREMNEDNDNYESLIKKANKMKLVGDYDSALNSYKKAFEKANGKEKAYCYEQIATVYAIQKRYGTALSFAQKAYNTYPNTEREILLARLYYKTGNLDKATNRVNNILKRDFVQDK